MEETIPGVPGDDYPIFAEVPDTSFFCDGLVEGGYYADPEAECQAFHICAADGTGGLTKYSFLCPNGTIFQQQYLSHILTKTKLSMVKIQKIKIFF